VSRGGAAGPPARARRLRQLPERAPYRRHVRPQRNVAEYGGQRGARPCEEEGRSQTPPLVDVLPAEQHVVLLQHGLDLIAAEAPADSAAVLVIHHAARLVPHLPAALPRHIAEAGVFQVERFEQRIETPELQELAAVERAGSAAAVEAGEKVVDRGVDAMAH